MRAEVERIGRIDQILPRAPPGPAIATRFRSPTQRGEHDDLPERRSLGERARRRLRAHVPRPGDRLVVARVARAQLDHVAERDEGLAQGAADVARSEDSHVHANASFRSLSSTCPCSQGRAEEPWPDGSELIRM
jgi:hypothetical protein